MTSLSNPVAVTGESNSVKFEVGAGITIGLVKFDQYQQKNYDDDQLKFWNDGSPMMGTKVTGIVHSVDGAQVGPKDDRTAPDVLRVMDESRGGAGRERDDLPVSARPAEESGIFLLDEDLRHAHFVNTAFLKRTFEAIVKRQRWAGELGARMEAPGNADEDRTERLQALTTLIGGAKA